MKIDRTKAKDVTKDVHEALQQIAVKHGLEYRPSRSHFDEAGVGGKFQFVDAEGAAKAESEIGAAYGYKVKVGDPIVLQGKQFTVSAISNRGKVSIKDAFGKVYTVRRPETLVPAVPTQVPA